MVDLWVVIQDVGVQTRVHALAGPACAEGATASKENLHSCQIIDVWVEDTDTLETDVDVIQRCIGVVDEPVPASVTARRNMW